MYIQRYMYRGIQRYMLCTYTSVCTYNMFQHTGIPAAYDSVYVDSPITHLLPSRPPIQQIFVNVHTEVYVECCMVYVYSNCMGGREGHIPLYAHPFDSLAYHSFAAFASTHTTNICKCAYRGICTEVYRGICVLHIYPCMYIYKYRCLCVCTYI